MRKLEKFICEIRILFELMFKYDYIFSNFHSALLLHNCFMLDLITKEKGEKTCACVY